MVDNNEIIIYQSEDGETRINVKFTAESVWLSQQELCVLYNTSKANVSEHIKHVFEDGELDEESVVRKFRTTAAEVIFKRADANAPMMGLTSFKGDQNLNKQYNYLL